MDVAIRILGPVEATREGRPVDLGPPQQRALIALLALRAPALVSVDTIVDVLWQDDPPVSAGKIVQTYVSRLRRALGPGSIERRGRGYRLSVARPALDHCQFEDLMTAGDFAAALRLWRGPALADVRDVEGLRPEAERLEELRLRAAEERLDAELASGRDSEVIAEIRTLVASEPLRERPIAQLMLALYRAGRQAEALDVYRDARRRFVNQLGIEPGNELKELERRILGQEQSLERPIVPHDPSVTELPHAEQRTGKSAGRAARWYALRTAPAAAALVTLVGLAAAFGLGRAHKPIVVRDNSLVRIDAQTNHIADDILVGRGPAGLLATDDGVWVANEQDRTLAFVDPDAHDFKTIGGVTDIAFLAQDEHGTIYASGWDRPTVWRIDAARREVTGQFDVRSRALALTIGGGSLWVADRLINSVTRYDLARRRVAGVTPVGIDPLVQTFGYGALWTANSDDGTVSVIRPGVSKPDTIPVDPKPFGIATGAGAVWVGSNASSRVIRIDAETHRVVARIPVPGGDLYSVRFGAGSVWTADRAGRAIDRIDPRTNKVVARIRLAVPPHDIAVHGDDVWVSVTSYEG